MIKFNLKSLQTTDWFRKFHVVIWFPNQTYRQKCEPQFITISLWKPKSFELYDPF